MKTALKLFLFIVLPILARAQEQDNYADSLITALNNATNDTLRLYINRKLGLHLQNSEPEPALIYHQAQQVLAEKLNL
ncbi:MAG: hypothetical protein OEU76_08250, partial [Cyclobacteriaceae bacterium]|nr:hypothetical protein [Cyclobacteriaceae bacterium]